MKFFSRFLIVASVRGSCNVIRASEAKLGSQFRVLKNCDNCLLLALLSYSKVWFSEVDISHFAYLLQQKLAQMLSKLMKIAEEFNVAILMTNHGSHLKQLVVRDLLIRAFPVCLDEIYVTGY